MISIIDYGAGNLLSVEKALKYLNQDTIITSEKDTILASDGVILPGVGSFEDAILHLKNKHLENTIFDIADKNIPFLGICLGMQLLFESSEESPGVLGLGLLKGKIKKIPAKEGLKIPQMGWNSIDIKPNKRLFNNIAQNSYVYFVHSYYLDAQNKDEVAATVEYSTTLDVAVEKNNIFATQFHPEKSGTIGLNILKNFSEICGGER